MFAMGSYLIRGLIPDRFISSEVHLDFKIKSFEKENVAGKTEDALTYTVDVSPKIPKILKNFTQRSGASPGALLLAPDKRTPPFMLHTHTHACRYAGGRLLCNLLHSFRCGHEDR